MIDASYGEAFARFAHELPAPERDARAQAYAQFAQNGFPDREQERWHYTDLAAALAQRGVRLPAAVPALALRADETLAGVETLSWINGDCASAAPGAPPPLAATLNGPLAGLHAAFARAGVQRVLTSSPAQPLYLLNRSQAEQPHEMHHLAHRLELRSGVEAVLIWQQRGDEGAERFAMHSLQLLLGAGAKLTLLRVQNESAQTTLCTQVDAQIGRDATLTVVNVDLGGQLVRNDWRLQLADAGAALNVYGLSAADGRTHLDNQVEVEHAAPHGTSRQYFRGLGCGRSRTILTDRVRVQPGAVKTDSEQRIANLMLAKGAEINAKPDLEIYADDVKCAHGASCGQLDETAVFYLRSRGVPEAAARTLLTYSFANEVLSRIAHESLRQQVSQAIAARLGSTLDLQELSA